MEKVIIEEIEKIIGVKFKNKDNLEKAFTHSSYANHYGKESNERLEFLGDSILNFVTTNYIFNHTTMTEGDLSKIRAKIVSKENLSQSIKRLNLQEYLLYYPDTDKVFSKKELCDLFESIIGSIYLDSGLENAKTFICNFLPLNDSTIDSVDKKLSDGKSELQEILQEQHMLPEYRVLEECGPDHAKKFKIGVYMGNVLIGVGEGTSKKDAENQAAQHGIDTIKARQL